MMIKELDLSTKLINRSSLIIILIILLGGFLRFYKLDWGQGLFTHPDEYHLVISASQLSFPSQMNPNFFSYGTVTIYLMYFTKHLLSIVPQLSDVNLFLIGRFYSALFSTLTILLVYKISRRFLSPLYSLLAAAGAALTPGLVQQAHFATPESNLTFFLLATLYFLLKLLESPAPSVTKLSQVSFFSLTPLALAAISLGLALGVKVSGAVFGGVLALALTLKSWPNIARLITGLLVSILLTGLVLFLVDPYLFLDFPHFSSSFKYESSLAAGNLAVFYTRQFINTTPLLFQLEKIYPFTLGIPLMLFGILGFIWMIFQAKKSPILLLLLASFLSLLLPNAFLFAKWTRFIAPTFPFFAIFSAFLLYKLSELKVHKNFPKILNTSYLILVAIWATAFFSIYLSPDIRATASNWLQCFTVPGSTFFVEEGNMVDIPLSGNFHRLTANFYNFEEDPAVRSKVMDNLQESDYFIIESRRIFLNHQRVPSQFPKTAAFYSALFQGELGFTKVKEFTSYPTLSLGGWKIEFPDEEAEETWSVFDHPVIRVYQKTSAPRSIIDGKLLEN